MEIKNRKKKIFGVLGFVVLVLLSFTIYDHIIYISTDDAQVQGHTVMIAAKVAGYVKNVNVIEGQKVKKGEVLIEIDPRDFDNMLRQIQNELGSLQARKFDLEKNYQRMATLYASQTISQQQFDNAKAGYSEIKSKYEALSAQVAQAQLNLDNTKITAPEDGFIAKKSVEKGQFAGAGVPLVGFVSSEERWVTANFKETEIESVKVGSLVKIKVDAITNIEFHGKVESISSATGSTFTLLPPDNATGNFTKVVQRVPVRIQFENISTSDIELLRAGLSAVVKVRK